MLIPKLRMLLNVIIYLLSGLVMRT